MKDVFADLELHLEILALFGNQDQYLGAFA